MEVLLLLWLTLTEEQTWKDTWGQATWKKTEQTYQFAVKSSRIIYNISNNIFMPQDIYSNYSIQSVYYFNPWLKQIWQLVLELGNHH